MLEFQTPTGPVLIEARAITAIQAAPPDIYGAECCHIYTSAMAIFLVKGEISEVGGRVKSFLMWSAAPVNAAPIEPAPSVDLSAIERAVESATALLARVRQLGDVARAPASPW